ncbi:CHAT domain-containing protein [Streptomyces sp. MNP-20]|uniref:CHAT domain-containing protein n=1 Tax=Streptomyces sp. MNP-20 TaxID=2721165 RepID=UPI001557A78C|nr:CHAT domain-containing protein [Streptomyces sp. MNP-20]
MDMAHDVLRILLTGEPGLGRDATRPEHPLVASARALATGEPRRALRRLAGVREPGGVDDMAAALRVAAHALDLNWYPGDGGAVLAEGDAERLAAGAPRTPAPEAALVEFCAARFLPRLLSARGIVETARTSGDHWAIAHVLRDTERQANDVPEADAALVRWVRAHVHLAAADVARRAGRDADVLAALDRCRHDAHGDPWVLARVYLLQGDAALTPCSHPDLLGLRLGPGHTAQPGSAPEDIPVDPAMARAHYEAADALYARLPAPRGRARVALRLAHLPRTRGDGPARAQAGKRAAALAEQSGAGALTALATTHRLLDRLADGHDADRRDLDELARWCRDDGSFSYLKGLVRLLLARAAAWQRDGLTLAALRCLRAARFVTARITAPPEADLTDRAYVDLVDRLNFRQASTVLLAADTAHATAALRERGADERGWLRAAELALALDRAVEALADPDLKGVAQARLGEVAATAERLAGSWPPARQAIDIVRESLRRAPAQLLRHRGRRALEAGFRDEAHAVLRAALDRAGDDALLRTALLYELGRRRQAHALASRLFRSGGLHPDHAVSLFLRLGDPHTARHALGVLDETSWCGDPERPWEDLARRAELAEAFGDHTTAVRVGEDAVARFERWSDQLVRDVLRTSMTDDVNVAAMYHIAARAHLGRADEAHLGRADEAPGGPVEQHPEGPHDTVDPDAERALAFELSDRCRGIAVDVLRALDALPQGPPLDAARRWLRAGSAWAAAYEGLVDSVTGDVAHTPSSARLRATVLAAEDELEAAEAHVATHAPGLLRGRADGERRIRGTRLDAVRAALPDDALLLMYETFDDDLVTWAVDRHGARHTRRTVHHRDLACAVRRFHSACASGHHDTADAGALARLLLDPVADAVRGRRRLYVVPHRALTLVPFAVLPLDDVPLGEWCVISQLPSASLVTRPGGGRPPRRDAPALLVGDPAYAPGRGLARLPGTATEVRAIARLLGTEPLLGDAATAAAVTASAPGRAVLHLATHGVLDERGPHRSHVALAGHDRLTVGDVTGLDLTADLVVLSACHTGRGTATAGGDVIGLVRAAVAAGARHAVVSLWPVDDASGAVLMTYFYEALFARPGTPVADALTTAQRRLRALDADGRATAYERLRETTGGGAAAACARDGRPPTALTRHTSPLPYHWAPFIHIGA